ncbi:unnamed protein product [Paramecium octaurelia]|uniref:Uncharacterized protein n=1 Tax=Paramecium octaurelia TaxID=43137 RepID=A0A8S1SEA5_PAROT|nr:unnamed protein product [Paramecium octaurelia]
MQTETNEINSIEESGDYQAIYQMNENLDQYFHSITNENQSLFIKYLVNCFQDPREEIKQVGEQYLKQLEQIVKPKSIIQNDHENKRKSLPRKFFKNDKNLGVSILSLDGSFILTDKFTTQILEWQHNSKAKKKLQDFCAVAGNTNLYKQIISYNQLLDTNQNQKNFKMTIYSEKIRKKAMKYVNQFIQKQYDNKSINRLNESIKEIQHFDDFDKMKIKYLKTVQINLKREKLSKQELLEQKKDNAGVLSSPQLEIMSDDIDDVLICEICVDATVENIDKSDIAKDAKLMNQEIKWQEKIKSLKDIIKEKHQAQLRSSSYE